MPETLARIRRFNRAVTRETGAMEESFLGRGRPLGAARVLWAIGEAGRDVADLRAELALDSGLLSRILRGLEAEGLAQLEPDPADRRRRRATLTERGQAERAEYDRLNDQMAGAILARAPRHRDALLAAMDLVAVTLNADRIDIRPADPTDPSARACLAAYFALLSDKISGISTAHVPDPDPDAPLFRPPHGTFLLAWCDRLPVGCVSLKPLEPGVAEVKRLWVDPAARGLGLARRLMRAVEDQARALGYGALKLDTNAALAEAITLYERSGWTPIAPYTGFPATHWFAKPL
ncbi:helix-turn-helix domain-containing GNAT family N-acetyltransferase [Fuscibacter oryzae]|uniref:MarR family transcriptional regulator n=1 Tax=Fuscibacter oryzae TaxID=2803939 RepID=A0A8J7MPA5_9RHOB|nr:helix-turn-helix domain-containing GNAT family N-acetyltransferase [Fuscibacter oryzae]MBL4926579.1 MarR family transcriptional regulator [Fuscibacter oryzae]